MRVKLLTLQGPAGREWYSFDRYPVRIGRKLDNQVAIADPSISRYHCEITLRQGSLWVVDLGSANGISVNDRRASESKVGHGDEITVGLVRFRVDISGATTTPGSEDARPVRLSRMNTVILDPAEAAWFPHLTQGNGRADRDLPVLLELCRALQARLPVSEITQRLLDLLERAIPFECGTVVLADPATGRLLETVKLPSNHTVELDASAGLAGRSKLSGENLTVPLLVTQTVLGAVCVRSNQIGALDRHHLHLAAAAAATAAAAIDNARREQRLAMRISLLEQERTTDAQLAGNSTQAQTMRRGIANLAASAAPALILGPRGIGKDAAARAIHDESVFKEGPLLIGRCLGRPQEELERLFFGVESESRVRRGWLDQAEGGTLCLDRVEGLGPELQQRVRAVLEQGEYRRIDGASTLTVRCRVIATAAESIGAVVASGAFSDELYNRLRGLTVVMPGLRERPSDIPVIAKLMADVFGERSGLPFDGISEAALVALTLYEWPDNVRELESTLRSAELRRTTNYIELEDLDEAVAESVKPDAPGGYHHEVREAKRQIILTAMEKVRGAYSAAADLLRINRTYLHRLIRNLDLRDEIAKRFDKT